MSLSKLSKRNHGAMLAWITYLYRTPSAFTMRYLRGLTDLRLNAFDCSGLPPTYQLAYHDELEHRINGQSRGAWEE